MEFLVLGPLEVLDDGHPVPIAPGHQRSILTLLLLDLNRVVSSGRILEAIWGDDLPETGTKAVAYHVSRLRDALAPGHRRGDTTAGGIETEPDGYVLRADPDDVDAVRFERLAQHAHELIGQDPAAARAAVDAALALWRGDALADVAYADFAQADIRRLEELRRRTMEDGLEADLALGRHAQAVVAAEALLHQDPLRDRVRSLLMLALYRCGRQAEALRIAGEGRRLLSEELGLDPSPDLSRLESQILRQDPVLDLRSADEDTGPAPRNPYKGLRHFTEADHPDFFGREAVVRRLVARLDDAAHDGRLLLIVGPSGSGKSSVVQAGLVPAIRAGAIEGSSRWRVATMVPGSEPFGELAAALRTASVELRDGAAEHAARAGDLVPLIQRGLDGGTPRLVLVIDQLEELYVRADDDVRARFVGALVAALRSCEGRLLVVAALRADFFDRPLRSSEFGELVRNGVEALTPMSRDELERAIVRPAEAVGVRLEPGLVPDVIADVGHEPTALPLLQYALTELFERARGRTLTRAAYAALGGAPAALGRAADAAWTAFDPAEREAARQVLLRFVVLGQDGELTARRVTLAELRSLTDTSVADAVLEELGRRRLLTFDGDPVTGEPTVEVAHEALLRDWTRVAGWVDEERRALWVRRRLDDAIAEWRVADRSPGLLASGERLDRFAAWEAESRLRPTSEERAYVAASLSERSRLERRHRRTRLAVGSGITSALVIAALLGGLLLNERDASAQLADVTTARGLAAGAVASLGKDPELSLLLAIQAANATVDRGYVVEEAYDALQWALQDAQIASPRDARATSTRQGPDGPRGVFLLPPDELMRTAAGYVGRSLFPTECMTYLHETDCRAVVAPPAGRPHLRVRTSAGVVDVTSLAVASSAGTRVSLVAEPPVDLSAVLAGFESDSGIDVVSASPAGGLTASLSADAVPDIAIVERPTLVARLAAADRLLDIDALVDTTALRAEAGHYAIQLGTVTVDGTAALFGAPFAATLDDLLWYPVDAFARAGYAPPSTPAELTALIARMTTDGRTPWCLGTQPDGSTQPETTTGPETMAWVEDLLLDRSGTSVYDEWTAGQLPFYAEGAESRTGPRSVAQAAVESLKAIVGAPGATYAGLKNAAWTPEALAALPMTAAAEPRCWLFHGSSTDRTTVQRGAGRVSAVPFPGAEAAEHAVLGRLFFVVALHDRPEVRATVAALLDRSVADAVASRSPNDGLLPVRLATRQGDTLAVMELARLRSALETDRFRARAVDLLPITVDRAFRTAVAAYLANIAPPLTARMFEVDQAWESVRSGTAP